MRMFLQSLSRSFGLKSSNSSPRLPKSPVRNSRLRLEELENRLVPASITLSNSSAPEFRPTGAVVGTLTASETGSGHTYTYALVSGTGSDGNGAFVVNGNQLLTTDSFDSAVHPSYSILVQATDETNQTFVQNFTITVTNNLNVSRTGRTFLVTGTPADDTFVFTENATRNLIVVNGSMYAVDTPSIDTVNINGQGGNDFATLTGGSGVNTSVLSPTAGTLTGTGYQVNVSNVPNITVMGGSGDTATLYDTSNNNNSNFTGTPTSSNFIRTGTFSETATGFGHVNAVAAKGTADSATLYDAAGNNTFVGSPVYSTLQGTGYSQLVAGFTTVSARHLSGTNDVGYLYDNSGTNTFTAHSGSSSLTADDSSYSVETVNYNVVTAFSAPGTTDNAAFYDVAGVGNAFVGTPTDAHMQGAGYFKQEVGFAVVNAYSSPTSTDYAYLSDTGGTNAFYASPTSSYLSGSGYFLNILNFKSVQATSAAGANDTATFVGVSSGSNVFISTTVNSYVYGPGFLGVGYGFKTVIAQGSQTDTANLYDSISTTVVNTADSGGINTYIGQGKSGTLTDDAQTFTATGFGYVNIINKSADYDQASTNGLTYNLTEFGVWH